MVWLSNLKVLQKASLMPEYFRNMFIKSGCENIAKSIMTSSDASPRVSVCWNEIEGVYLIILPSFMADVTIRSKDKNP